MPLAFARMQPAPKLSMSSTQSLGADGARFLIPALPLAPNWAPQPIVSWWLLLFSLATTTRYEPAQWLDAINVSNSALAVPIEEALDLALEAIPRLALICLSNVAT
jgi:hypothetical protein